MKHPWRTALTRAAAVLASLCAGLLPATADASTPAPRPAAQRHTAAQLRAALARRFRPADGKAKPARIHKPATGAGRQKASAAAEPACPGAVTFQRETIPRSWRTTPRG